MDSEPLHFRAFDEVFSRERGTGWYWIGLGIGAGFVSKYTAVLLPAAGAIALLAMWRRKPRLHPPYLVGGILLTLLLISPVIYWNATHEWASFLFQTAGRGEDLAGWETVGGEEGYLRYSAKELTVSQRRTDSTGRPRLRA